MRITSSDLSLRLCAFSVLSARICHATSRFGTTSAVIAFAPSRRIASSRWRPLGVQKPFSGAVTAMIGSRNMPVRSSTSASSLVVHVGKVALERRRLDAVDRQHGEEQRILAERIVIAAEHEAAFVLDCGP